MSIPIIIYLIEVLSALNGFAIAVACFSGVTLVFSTLFIALDPDVSRHKLLAARNAMALLFAISAIVLTLVPSKKAMYMMAGAHLGKEVVTSETGQKVQELLTRKLDEMLKEKK